jgi:hypothetical protein
MAWRLRTRTWAFRRYRACLKRSATRVPSVTRCLRPPRVTSHLILSHHMTTPHGLFRFCESPLLSQICALRGIHALVHTAHAETYIAHWSNVRNIVLAVRGQTSLGDLLSAQAPEAAQALHLRAKVGTPPVQA